MDQARKWTDKQLAKMEKDLTRYYHQAEKELREKWDNFLKAGNSEIKELEKELRAAQYAASDSDIARLEKRLAKAKQDFTLGNRYYRDMVADVTRQLADVNAAALTMMQGKMPSIYVVNYNFSSEVAKKYGVSFTLVDQNTVAHMIKAGDIKLPQSKFSIAKDMRWNTKQLNSAVLQGILQGESMDQIAGRIEKVIGNNEKSAIRTARTLTTGAESRGRLDSYRQLNDRGIVTRKQWMATHDGRVRDWHADIDGQTVDVDDYFIDGLGNELECPGDPGAPGETVYNCRCTMVSKVIGFRKDDGRIEYI